jgi:hypothetical protein
VRRGEGALGADHPLGDGGLRHEERPGDLRGGQPAEQPEGERDPGLAGEHRVAGGEDQPEQVVPDHVVQRLHPRRGPVRLVGPDQVAAQLRGLALQPLGAPEEVDRPVLGGGHQPGGRPVGDAGLRPPLQRRDQRVLGQLLGQADVPGDPGEGGDELG